MYLDVSRIVIYDICNNNNLIIIIILIMLFDDTSNVSVIPIIIWNNSITTSCRDLIGRSNCDELSPMVASFLDIFWLVSSYNSARQVSWLRSFPMIYGGICV